MPLLSSLNTVKSKSAPFNLTNAGLTWGLIRQRGNLGVLEFVNNRFVAGGISGNVRHSTDGLTWTSVNIGVTTSIRGVSYGAGLYVVVGVSGIIYTSPDLVTWTSRTSGTTETLNCLIYANGLFVAGGTGGVILTSSNGTTWSSQTSNTGNSITGITYGNGIFLAGTFFTGDYITSPDGITWTLYETQSGINTNGALYPAYGNGYFLIVSAGGLVRRSTDGISWTTLTSILTSEFVYSLRFCNNVFIACSDTFNTAATTTDGSSWTITAGGTNLPDDGTASFGAGRYVIAGGSGGGISTSTNGTTWARATANPLPNYALFKVHYGGGFYFVADFSTGRLYYSSNGLDWSLVVPGGGDIAAATGRTSNGTYIAVGVTGTVRTSTTLTSWTSRTSGTTSQLNSVATDGNNIVVVVGSGGVVIRSDDNGTTWSTMTSGTTVFLANIQYLNGNFVACGGQGGSTGTVISSTDGITWTTRVSGFADDFNAVTYGNGLYMVVGDGGTIRTSPDLVTWTSRTSGTTVPLYGVAYGNGRFVAGGGTFSTPTLRVSTNGTTWSAESIDNTGGNSTSFNINGVAFGPRGFVASSSALGHILVSPLRGTSTI